MSLTPIDTAADQPRVVAHDNGSVTITPGQDNVKVVISFTDESGTTQVVTAEKQTDGTWIITDGGNTGVTVDVTTGLVTIPADKVQDGSTVRATSTDDSGNTATSSATAQANPKPISSHPTAPAVKGKQLPNTGDSGQASLASGALLLFLAGLLKRRKKKEAEDEY